MQELSADQVRRLAEDVRSKILARESLLMQAEGEITIRIFRRSAGFDIKLTVTTD
ncbi:MAG: hypothetical protein NTZ05_16950 [Chloroflexi bacterium]|nr:hypothetical protein [Chloroflexota bacterium]